MSNDKLTDKDYLVVFKIHEEDDPFSHDKLTFGQKMSDKLSSIGGSWKFILSFSVFLMIWVILNSVRFFWSPIDPYPFVFLNLILSCIAAVQAPIIMMSQNRLDSRDRWLSEKDYHIDLKSEEQIRELNRKLDILLGYYGIDIDEEEEEK